MIRRQRKTVEDEKVEFSTAVCPFCEVDRRSKIEVSFLQRLDI